MSEAAGLVAWLHADTANPAAARAHYGLAIDASRRARHALLHVYMQGSYGQYATSVGDAAEGVQLIRQAAAHLPAAAPHVARAWLAGLEAMALAHLGDREAQRSLAAAERHADAGKAEDPVWPWVFRFGQNKIDEFRVVVASRLGLRSAVPPADNLACSRSPKQAAMAGVEHARALALAGEREQACRLAVVALDVAQRYDSERIRHTVREFRSGLTYAGHSVRELDEQLRATYRERG